MWFQLRTPCQQWPRWACVARCWRKLCMLAPEARRRRRAPVPWSVAPSYSKTIAAASAEVRGGHARPPFRRLCPRTTRRPGCAMNEAPFCSRLHGVHAPAAAHHCKRANDMVRYYLLIGNLQTQRPSPHHTGSGEGHAQRPRRDLRHAGHTYAKDGRQDGQGLL